MGRPLRNLTGQKFGMLTARYVCAQTLQKAAVWFCDCDCGGTNTVKGSKLVRGEIVSCGCQRGKRDYVLTPLEERLWRYCIPEPNSGCWLWIGKANVVGYGVIGLGGRRDGTALAHRVSYQIYRGEIPEGKEICHKCDNRACINPDHMYLGTRSDNLYDRYHSGPINRYGFTRTAA